MRQLDFEATWGPRVLGVIDAVLGAGQWVVPKQGGQLLAMSHPDRGATWELPHKVWHLDYPAPAALDALPGVQLFLCLDHLGANAGATLCALGSHRLIDRLRQRQAADWPGASLQVRKALARESRWLFAMGETFHFIGLCLMVGGLMIVDLRLLGYIRRIQMLAGLAFLTF